MCAQSLLEVRDDAAVEPCIGEGGAT